MNSEERLLDQLLAEEGIDLVPLQDIPHVDSADPSRRVGPLSFAQQRMYFLDRVVQDKAAYHIAYCVHFSDGLDVDRLRAAFAGLLAGHPALRTRFLVDGTAGLDGQSAALLQEVMPSVALDWEESVLPAGSVDSIRRGLSDDPAEDTSPLLCVDLTSVREF